MNVSHPIAETVVARFHSHQGRVLSVSDLLNLGPRASVDQALSRLVRKGAILRVGRGLYELPRVSSLLNQPRLQSPDCLARAWAKKNGLRLTPSGAYAANLLGLSTQVPAKIIYYTNGRTKTIRLGPYTVRLLNRGPKTMDLRGRMSPLVFEALRHLGKNGSTPQVLARLQTLLPPKEKAELLRNLHCAPAWMKPFLERVAEGEKQ